MSKAGIIGGSGFYELPELEESTTSSVKTPYGVVEAVTQGRYRGREIVFLPRHGPSHKTPPHKINYRANIAAMSQLGVTNLIAFNAAGGIHEQCGPETLVVPDQIIDYTYGRQHSFFNGDENDVTDLTHIDFTEPLNAQIRDNLAIVLDEQGANCHLSGTYGCTQGPRLETAAEIRKLERDGCDLVGMTLMPEAGLAKERSINYASLSFIVNWCAGIQEEVITLNKIMARLNSSIAEIREVILKTHTLG